MAVKLIAVRETDRQEPETGGAMSLSSYKVSAVVAVSDLTRAKEFYEGKLGLTADEANQPPGVRRYTCAAGTWLDVYESPDHAGKSTATLVGWNVDDLERVVDELASTGVTFEQYDEPVKTDEKGIFTAEGEFKAAWFKDPDGNTHAIADQ
jgi:catechol 2,3-dioxygenase-like lactoylglutathione lyase family enzyme